MSTAGRAAGPPPGGGLFAAGLALSLVVLAVGRFGDQVRDWPDPTPSAGRSVKGSPTIYLMP